MSDDNNKVLKGLAVVGTGAGIGGTYYGAKKMHELLKKMPAEVKREAGKGALVGGGAGAGLLALMWLLKGLKTNDDSGVYYPPTQNTP